MLRPLLLLAFIPLLAATSCRRDERASVYTVSGGDAVRGRELIAQWGCGSCHVIPGVRGATALVGPPLTSFGQRAYIAGTLPNGGENLTYFLMNPQEVRPGTAMPDLNLTNAHARDIAAYLLTLGR